ncbi:hypothetical protein LCGC14_2692320 [marine sediment metagenome]|uniref:Type II secretion system protein GspI C-terminal domain-containing protein n=1 Tax=marine sediment metagenome TaxID=412755 RepID=A0A0F9CA07_9ZZZZ
MKLKNCDRQDGFTLLETILAVVILAAIGVVLMTALDANTRTTGQISEELVAKNLIAAAIEEVRKVELDTAAPPALPYEPERLAALLAVGPPAGYDLNISTECNDDPNTDIYSDCESASTWQRISVSVLREGRSVLSFCTFKSAR